MRKNGCFEVLELLLEHNKGHETSAKITTSTFTFTTDEAVTRLINNGLALLPVKDVKMMLRLTEEEVHEELLKVDKWMVKDEKWIERKYMFSDYLKGVEFVSEVSQTIRRT